MFELVARGRKHSATEHSRMRKNLPYPKRARFWDVLGFLYFRGGHLCFQLGSNENQKKENLRNR